MWVSKFGHSKVKQNVVCWSLKEIWTAGAHSRVEDVADLKKNAPPHELSCQIWSLRSSGTGVHKCVQNLGAELAILTRVVHIAKHFTTFSEALILVS